MSDKEGKDDKDDKDDILEDALELFKLANDMDEANRASFLSDIEFSRLGKQWPDAVRIQREREGRPCLTFNRFPAFLRQVINDARQNKPAIACHPVDDGADVETSQILTGLIRNIEQTSNADVAYDTAIEMAVSGGIGYIRVNTKYAFEDKFDLDICIDRISNPMTIWGDHRSTAADSSDWDYAFVTELLTEDEFKKRYPKAEETTKSFESDDRDSRWFEDDAIRIAEYWTREEVEIPLLKCSNGEIMDEESYEQIGDILEIQGITVVARRSTKAHKVTQYIITGSEVLETNDWPGRYIPIVPVYGDEVWVEGKRHWQSLIFHAKGAQEAYNYWRTSAIEKVALDTKAPWLGPKGAFKTDASKWATANTQNHAYIEYDGQQAPHRTPAGGVPAGDLQMALNASDDMKAIMGIHDASLGARSNETSGVAIRARQREGDVSTFHFIDNLSRAIRHTGRIVIDLIPKIYNTERIVRILKEDGDTEMTKINGEVLVKGIPRVYDMAVGKYDITVSNGPSFSTKREEVTAQMTELIRAYPDAAPLIGDLLAKNFDWPGADDIAKRFKAMLPPQARDDTDNPEAQALKQQIEEMKKQGMQMLQAGQQELQKVQAENAQLKGSLQADMAKVQIDAESVKIDQFKAESERMKIDNERVKAEQEQELKFMELQITANHHALVVQEQQVPQEQQQ